MSVFAGIGKVKPSEGGVYVIPGVYACEIQALKSGKARDGVPFFVAELLITESDNPQRPVGSMMSWMVKLSPAYLDTALGNIKGFLATLADLPSSDIDEAGVEAAVSAANPFADHKIRLSATEVKTKAGKPFTKVSWRTY